MNDLQEEIELSGTQLTWLMLQRNELEGRTGIKELEQWSRKRWEDPERGRGK